MKLIGFNFTKINAERYPKKESRGVKINTKIDLSEVEEVKSDVLKKDSLIAVKFLYEIDYSPDYAKITLEGNLVLAMEHKIAKNILKEWKSKKIQDELRAFVFNIIFKKANIKALQLEEELNIPFHMPMPSIKVEDKKEQ